MWASYFHKIQYKYAMRVSLKKTLIIRLDGRDVTKDKNISLISENKDGFLNCFEQTIKHFTQKYNCLAVYGSDEVSFVFREPILVIEDLDKEKTNRANEIVALFSQCFFDYFNNLYNRENKVFWRAMCFSIETEKINSYIKFRSGIIKNVMTTYFLKRMSIRDAGKIKMNERQKQCNSYPEYEKIKKFEKGMIYLNGDKLELEEFLSGNIKKIEEDVIKENLDEFFDITKWDI